MDETHFFHLDFTNEDHIEVKHMGFEVRAHHEEQLVLPAKTHASDLAWLRFVKEIYFEHIFTVELGPDVYLPFVIRNKRPCWRNPHNVIHTEAAMLAVLCHLGIAKIDSVLLILFELKLHLRVYDLCFFVKKDFPHFKDFLTSCFQLHFILKLN